MSYQGYGHPYGHPPAQGYGYGQPPPNQQQMPYPPPQQPPGFYPPIQHPPSLQQPPSLQHPSSLQHPLSNQHPPPAQYQPPGQQQAQQPPYGSHPAQAYGHQLSTPQPLPHPAHFGPPYGAPPSQPYGGQLPPTPPSLGYGPLQLIQWDGLPDAQALRSAMKGFGTDEKALIRILSDKDPLQIHAIREAFDGHLKRNLIKDIKSETSGWFEKGLLQLARGPLEADVYNLHEAMAGFGTREAVLNDILLSRSNADLKTIQNAYHKAFGKTLLETVKADLSMKTERHFLMVLAANRAEDSAPVIPQLIDDDVMQLYQATEAKTGTDALIVCRILSARNDNQIRAIAHTYRLKFSRDLEEVIKSEFSGHMREALLFQLRHGVDKYMHAAKLLEDAMVGIGTRDLLLASRVIRYHWDPVMLANVKGAFVQRYGRTLADRIKGETSGDYQKLMLACLGDWHG